MFRHIQYHLISNFTPLSLTQQIRFPQTLLETRSCHSMDRSLAILLLVIASSGESIYIMIDSTHSLMLFMSLIRVPFPLHATSTNDLGYKVVVQASNVESCSPTSGCIRPVGIDFSSDGVLFVSSDGSGEVSWSLDLISVNGAQ